MVEWLGGAIRGKREEQEASPPHKVPVCPSKCNPSARPRTALSRQVPPMTPALTEQGLQRELGVDDLGELFEWIDLERPLGSASISQVARGRRGGRGRWSIVGGAETFVVCVCMCVCVCVCVCVALCACVSCARCVSAGGQLAR